MIATKTDQFEQTERDEDFAQLLSALGRIQGRGAHSDPVVASTDANDTVRVLMEFQAAARLARAARNPTFDYSVVDRAKEQLKRGNKDGALESAKALHSRFLTESFNYKQNLEREILPLHTELRSLERARNRLAYVALVLQVAGLILLLLKELPATADVKLNSDGPSAG